MADKIQSALSKIESEFETPQLLSDVVFAIAGDEQKRGAALSALETAIRYFCLMDLFHETGDIDYYNEYQRQRALLFRKIERKNHQQLQEVEGEILSSWRYWDLERELKGKIRQRERVSDDEVRDYVLKKPGDAMVYGTIAQVYGMPPALVQAVYKRGILADVVDDVQDYEEDVSGGQPNILVLHFLNRDVTEYPDNFDQARTLSRDLGNSRRILGFGRRVYEKALGIREIEQAPQLKEGLEAKYHELRELLSGSFS